MISADVSIREALPSDWPAIVACQHKMEERIGRSVGSMDLPELMIKNADGEEVRNPAVFYWVAERDGQVVDACYLELCLEWSLVGVDPGALHEITEFRNSIFAMASKAGARWLHAFVMPGPWEQAHGRHLDKAKLKPTGLVHYRRMI